MEGDGETSVNTHPPPRVVADLDGTPGASLEDVSVAQSETTPILRSQWIWRLHRSLSNATGYEGGGEEGRHPAESLRQRTLGTFAGVFCPVALSMFSTMLYLRGGFVVGQAGLIEALSQFLLAYIILVLTVFSICAISTNGLVEGGGAYYMISRALGPEFGGSIGFLFFVANIFSCALYISGVVEGLVENFRPGSTLLIDNHYLPDKNQWWHYLYATLFLFLCLVVCLIGGAMFARTSAFILLIVVICTLSVIISFLGKSEKYVAIPRTNSLVYGANSSNLNVTYYGNYTGLSVKTFHKNLFHHYTTDFSTDRMMNFTTVFAILFSSVTGIMNGANMSGELKDPSRSIPRGTLAAVGFTFFTYVILSFLIAASCDRYLLVNDYIFLQDVNYWPPFVVIGLFAATLSAALGNLIGASRVLERLAKDQLFWFFLKPAVTTTRKGNPFVAVLISWFLVQLVLLIGSLNAIAPLTSVFFLLSYAATNVACLGLEIASAPNFRPTFKYFSWHTALLGLIGCIIMCFFISVVYASLAIIIFLILVILLHLRSFPVMWGSISQALIFHQVRKYLLMLDSRKDHVKYWRPQMLLLVAHPRHCCELLDFVNDIKKGGLYLIGHIKLGKLDDFTKDPIQEEYPKWLGLIDHLKIKAFVEITLANSVSEGFIHLVRISGLGGMKPNTVCFGFYDSSMPTDSLAKTRSHQRRFFGSVEGGTLQQLEYNFGEIRKEEGERHITEMEYVKLIRDALKLQKNVCVCRHFNQLDKAAILSTKTKYYIDVWPLNFFQPDTSSFFDNTCLYMLQLACILHMVPSWKKMTMLRVFLCVDTQHDNTLQKEKILDDFLRQLRIIARVQIVPWDNILAKFRDQNFPLDFTQENMQEFQELPPEIVHLMNELILSQSSHTATTFLYLPCSPMEPKSSTYLKQLSIISEGLPPTVFVHGLHPVTSTTL